MNTIKVAIPPLLEAQLRQEAKDKDLSIAAIVRWRLAQSYHDEKIFMRKLEDNLIKQNEVQK